MKWLMGRHLIKVHNISSSLWTLLNKLLKTSIEPNIPGHTRGVLVQHGEAPVANSLSWYITPATVCWDYVEDLVVALIQVPVKGYFKITTWYFQPIKTLIFTGVRQGRQVRSRGSRLGTVPPYQSPWWWLLFDDKMKSLKYKYTASSEVSQKRACYYLPKKAVVQNIAEGTVAFSRNLLYRCAGFQVKCWEIILGQVFGT